MIETINSAFIHEATTDNFESLVLKNSNKGPVLVNFWSRKAGPCLRLYPILDKLIHDYGGKLLLVNVDTENEFVFTKQYGIASVPTLKLFRNGQVMETLHGYQSEDDLSKILGVYVTRDSDIALSKAIQYYAEGSTTEAYEMIANAIVSDPVNPRLPLALCKLLKHEKRYSEALHLIRTLPGEIRENREIVKLKAVLTFCEQATATKEISDLLPYAEANPDECEVKQQLIAKYVVDQQFEPALDELVKIIELDQGYDHNYARKAMLLLFDILGVDHEYVAKYRPYLKRYTH